MILKKTYVVTVGDRSKKVVEYYERNGLFPSTVIFDGKNTEEVPLRILFKKIHEQSISPFQLVHIKRMTQLPGCVDFLRDRLNYNLKSIIRPKDYELTDGHIGSMIGHRLVWQHISNKEDGYYLICEDDWIPPLNLHDHLQKLQKIEKTSCEMIYLFHCDRLIKNQNVINQYCDDDKTWGIPNPLFGLQAYILTPKGATKLLQNITDTRNMVVMWLCDDLTGMSILTSDWYDLSHQKYADEASYMQFVIEHQSKFQSFQDWNFLNAYAFRKNIGRLLNVESTTDASNYSLHNLLTQYFQAI